MQEPQDALEPALGLLLAERLATRLCHDLGGPLGGLTAALGEAGTDPEALSLAREATVALRLRLKLLRAAWGAPAALAPDGLRDLAAGLPNAHRLQLELAGPVATAALPPLCARLLLNALLLAAESLPRGGQIVLEGDPAREIVLAIDGANSAWPEGLGLLLADRASAWTSLADALTRTPRLQAALTALLAHQAGARGRLLLGATGDAASPVLFDLSALAG